MKIKSNSVCLFITGAGISRSAGIPTYYGDGGLYNNAESEFGRPISEVITPDFFEMNPRLLWDKIFSKSYEYSVNANQTIAHKKIKEIQESARDSLVITQNIDGLHGIGLENVCEIHGTIHYSHCHSCKMDVTTFDIIEEGDYFCKNCKGQFNYMRPSAVLFGEMYSDENIKKIDSFFNRNDQIDYAFFVGSQTQFPHFVEMMQMASRFGADTYVVNPDESVRIHGAKSIVKTADDFFSNVTIG